MTQSGLITPEIVDVLLPGGTSADEGAVRFLRVASLVTGITLIVMGVVGILGRRSELRDERDRHLETTAELAVTQLDGVVARVGAVLTVASTDVSLDVVADALALPVCSRLDGAAQCSTGETVDDVAVDEALAASTRRGAPAVVAGAPDDASAASLVVVAVDQGARRLYVPLTVDDSLLPGDEVARTELVPLEREPLFRPTTTGDRRSVAAPSMVEFDGGSWAIRATAPDAVQLSTEERWLFGTQLVLGAVLALLALGGMVAEQRTLRRRATTDALTELPNRAEFERMASELLDRLGRDGRSACLFVVDLDNFKLVNDTIGHDAGDRVLVEAATRLRRAVRDSDLVGRWGGDEFVVLMPGVADARAIPARAATIANALAGMPAVGTLTVEASVGAALFPSHGQTLEDLLRKADRMMYAAKVQAPTRRSLTAPEPREM